MNSQRTYRAVRSLVPFGVGLLFFVQSVRLPFGTLNNPGPGLWPTCLSAAIMAMALLLPIKDRRTDDGESFTRDSRFPLYGALSLAMFILLFESFGLTLPCMVVFLYWMRFLGRERWRSAIPVAAGLTAAIYLVFAQGLDIPFPEDRLLRLLLDRNA